MSGFCGQIARATASDGCSEILGREDRPRCILKTQGAIVVSSLADHIVRRMNVSSRRSAGNLPANAHRHMPGMELWAFPVVFIQGPFQWVIVDIRPYFLIIRFSPDDMIVKSLLPNAFSKLKRYGALELPHNVGNTGWFLRLKRNRKDEVDVIRHHDIFIHRRSGVMVRDSKNRGFCRVSCIIEDHFCRNDGALTGTDPPKKRFVVHCADRNEIISGCGVIIA